MTGGIEKLMTATVDLAHCAAPATVRSDDGRMRAVAASAYLAPAGINRGVHLVVYNRGDDELIAPDDQHWAVAMLYNREDQLGISYLAHGDYDMTYAEAIARFVTRVEQQA